MYRCGSAVGTAAEGDRRQEFGKRSRQERFMYVLVFGPYRRSPLKLTAFVSFSLCAFRSVIAFVWQMMHFNSLRMLRGSSTRQMREEDLVRWANDMVLLLVGHRRV